MSEKYVFNLDGERIEMTPENTIMARYAKLGEAGVRLAMYDHIRLVEEDKYLFAWLEEQGEEFTADIQAHMIENGFVTMLNMPTVEDDIVAEYDRQMIQPELGSLENGVPKEWGL